VPRPAEPSPLPAAPSAGPPEFRDAVGTWARIGLLSFGGPAGQIALMHRVLVEERRWIGEQRFLHALNYCMLLPGPEAQQLATYIGWLLHGVRGGLAAGVLFVLPGFVAILTLSILYAGLRDALLVQGLFAGLKPAVVAIVAQALIRLGGRALGHPVRVAIAAVAFLSIFVLGVPFPLIVLGAGAAGWLAGRFQATGFGRATAAAAAAGDAEPGASGPARAPSVRGALRTAAVCAVLWGTPVALLAVLTGGSVWTRQALFFSQAAVVTFGGAYAVLSFVAQRAVEGYGWLEPGEMLDGLGMAETTPGPLIMVVQFVGFMAAYRDPGTLSPLTAGVLGAILTTWVTFVPCFLFVFVGAPWVEHIRGRPGPAAALAGITAAVVGVILNLAIWFTLHVVFAEVREVHAGPVRLLVPRLESVDPLALAIAAGAGVALFALRFSVLRTLALAAAAGMLGHLVLGAR
jgi:chromate transporter